MRGTRKRGFPVAVALLAAACGGPGTPGPSASRPPSSPNIAQPTPMASSPKVHTVVVATVRQPVAMATRAGDQTLYIVSKKGAVWALRDGRIDPTPALDLSGQVTKGNEQGLLGMAFSPSGAYAYVDYTDLDGDTNIVEFAWRDGGADLTTRRRILFVDQPFPNHNGGNLVFGPDGDLYIGMGDGGSDATSPSPGDPLKNGQNMGVLLGKMLRIQPRLPDGSLPPGGKSYAVPAGNTFLGRAGARPEIWAFGLRNPWRSSFDRVTDDLWIGDVGAGAREEIDLHPAGSGGGQNYGWSLLEGTVAWGDPPPDAIPPLFEYDHRGGACAVTGGFVYRGSAIPDLAGWYVFGDFCTGVIQVLQIVPGGRRVYVAAGSVIRELASFGQDQEGELYALSLAGDVYKLVP